ncbi:hypothetical protein BGZ61DRAFT_498544 [Ilyonectria robusta]|uniref:uncharacterized protein n=1 Tax=Ilyonectria robusta TaxID=1079257 RepID=UPI001E8CBD47|nr:uncharacterized protein BGZ61DRAFT_498544 [Ilyonectria robusta]KAH8666118.1 hypothetical protein BGZ61DRAFT_498544 [Ilyonectria robusta]
MHLTPRDEDDDVPVHGYVNPYTELNIGLWSLFAGATVLLFLRLYVKVTRRHGLWYDDYILTFSWMLLLANNALIIHEFATGYVLKDSTESWDDRMHILINISSCGTLIGQALTKTAFAVTLIRISNQWQQYVLWFCILSMNLYMVVKVIFQWAKVCDKDSYDVWYRLNFCIGWKFRDSFKEGGNVYNVIMDFVFASFPWLITRGLEMRRVEKIGLSATMSLGMIVAIVTAIRIGWKDNGNDRDKWYIWRNGMSQVWYSSEVAGTIMVQCIPILRPILQSFHTSLTSKKLGSTSDAQSTTWLSKFSGNRVSTRMDNNGHSNGAALVADERGLANNDRVELRDIPEEPAESWREVPTSSWPLDDAKFTPETHTPDSLPHSDSWALPRGEDRSGRSLDVEQDRGSHSSIGFDVEPVREQGLSPPPRRLAQ